MNRFINMSGLLPPMDRKTFFASRCKKMRQFLLSFEHSLPQHIGIANAIFGKLHYMEHSIQDVWQVTCSAFKEGSILNRNNQLMFVSSFFEDLIVPIACLPEGQKWLQNTKRAQ